MIHALQRAEAREARRLRLTAEAIHCASAPFHCTGRDGLALYQDFLARMDAIINPPDALNSQPSALSLAAEIAAFDRLQAHFRR